MKKCLILFLLIPFLFFANHVEAKCVPGEACNYPNKNNQPDQIGIYRSENIEEVISRYLETKLGKANNNGKIFSEYKILDTVDKKEGVEYELWVLISEFYMKESELVCPNEKAYKYKNGCVSKPIDNPYIELGSGRSGPVVLFIRKDSGKYFVVNHKEPRDGAYYSEDIKKIFSKKAVSLIFEKHNETANELKTQIDERAKDYFKSDFKKVPLLTQTTEQTKLELEKTKQQSVFINLIVKFLGLFGIRI
jgi:hypothetical protein